MKPLRSTLAGLAAFAALTLTATACDTSPYAATVNSQVIRQTELNAELRQWAKNTDYVSAFNSANTSSGATVAGDAPGTYSTTWVATILDGMVSASAVRQRVIATDQPPDSATLAAARSINELSETGWLDFSPAFRDVLVMRVADEAVLTPASVARATLLATYNQYRPYFFLQICTVEASAFSAAQAASVAAQGVPNGVSACYTQAQFEVQSTAFQTAVLNLAVGKVSAPIKTSYGFEVVRVVSRALQPFSPELQRVLSLAINSAQGNPNNVVGGLLAKANIRINPAYGSWSKSSQVVPPVAPSAST